MESNVDCEDFIKNGHTCILSGDANMEWMTQINTCIGFCLPYSKMPEKCAEMNFDGASPTKSSGSENHHAKEETKITESDCNEYEKFKRNKCIVRTEKECYEFEKWDGVKCEMRCD